ncbi:MAG: Uroporphyrinogen deCOase protein [Thermoproteota archaeon]|nr:Uroporphyrinogen deCOase protein [Thermoproteota archaeon]
MNPRESMLAAFSGKKADRIVWQPRLHIWYEANKKQGTLPKKYSGKEILEIYDDLEAMPRSYHFYNSTIKCNEGNDAELWVRNDREAVFTKYITPKGELKEARKKTVYGAASYVTEYLLKDVEDFKVLTYVLENQTYEFDKNLYEDVKARIGNRAASTVNLPHVPLQSLFINYMGFEKAVIAMWKHQKEVESLLNAIEENHNKMMKTLMASPIEIVNFSANIHHDLCSPPLFKKYILPYYQRATKDLHSTGKFTTSHWDGRVSLLLPFVKETGLDGIECLTPKPMGDVTLEELHEALGDMILVDGIPANHFLPWVNNRTLKEFTLKLLNTFKPHLIAGISDMLPPNGDIEKVRFVGKIVNEYEL